ncbi:sulfatase family protein [Coraliomargarita parva]|uniref:sulfatase family protein n=1 Tax=Coraliomargarita parva TaxID=3014050 RepID=UPI0022B32B5E|nr:sulfatase [Coraliomargarita parva]
MKKRPNILFMLSDDHAVGAISACGSKINQTPNLDRLANEGGVFNQSFCCNSICTPSRAAILTGKHSFQNGVLTLRHSLSPVPTTFIREMRNAGYETAIAGKWHLHCEPQDFDFWKVLPGQGNYYNPEYLTAEGSVQEVGYSEDITTDTILDWIQNKRSQDKPFVACCHFKAPHRAWFPPLRHMEKYTKTTFPTPDNLADDYAGRSELLQKNEMMIARHLFWDTDLKVSDPGPNASRLDFKMKDGVVNDDELHRMTPEERALWDEFIKRRESELQNEALDDEAFLEWVYQKYLADYLGCVASIDDNVGRLLDYLDEAGLAEDTIVVYCSDQGFYLGEHGWYDKRWMFEESMRMPLLMRWPDTIEPGSKFEQLVQNIDYAPTFLEAAGLETPADMHGTSLLRVVEGQEIHEDLYYHYYMNRPHGVPAHDGVRTQRYKLIHFYTTGEYNLFDLEDDPTEMKSVHSDPAYAEILQAMKLRYEVARERFEIPNEFPPLAAPLTVEKQI